MPDTRKTDREITIYLSDDSETLANISIELLAWDSDSLAGFRLNALDMKSLGTEVQEVVINFVTGTRAIDREAAKQED